MHYNNRNNSFPRDNFELYDLPRSEYNYKTPGIEEYKQEITEYVSDMSRMILAKRGIRLDKEHIVTREELLKDRENNAFKVNLSQICNNDFDAAGEEEISDVLTVDSQEEDAKPVVGKNR